jgi:hypothetical protein
VHDVRGAVVRHARVRQVAERIQTPKLLVKNVAFQVSNQIVDDVAFFGSSHLSVEREGVERIVSSIWRGMRSFLLLHINHVLF